MKKLIDVNCGNCEKPFTKTEPEFLKTNNHFCSRSCSATYNNKHYPKRKIERKCSIDGCDSFIKNCKTILCEFHVEEKKKGKKDYVENLTIGEYRQRIFDGDGNMKHHRSSIHSGIRVLCRLWNKDLIQKPCNKCGYDKHVELCHIKSLASFEDDALLKEVNGIDNVIQLCRNCHWELDHNL